MNSAEFREVVGRHRAEAVRLAVEDAKLPGDGAYDIDFYRDHADSTIELLLGLVVADLERLHQETTPGYRAYQERVEAEGQMRLVP